MLLWKVCGNTVEKERADKKEGEGEGGGRVSMMRMKWTETKGRN